MVSDEMVGDACRAAYGPYWSFFDAENMRRALEAVAPAIRAQALEEAAKIAEDEAASSVPRPLFYTDNHWGSVYRKRIAAAIRAAKEVW